MLWPLRNRTYRHLFAAQVIALSGTGLATVALGLLAYELAGADAGVVLGTALAIKMIAYVGVAPVANAFADRLPRRAFLVSMDAVRAAIALILPFVDQVWQVYVLIFLLQSASAAFTPTFQAAIPDVLPEEKEYTKALSLSRLAYDLESLLSPALAAALLTLVSFHWLFAGTAFGFVLSALLVLSTVIPQMQPSERGGGIYERTTRGIRIYLATPRLRGLLALNLSVAAAGAMVIVNTVVYVQSVLARPEPDVAVALAMFGGGSMLAALLLPRMLDRLPDRTVMLSGAALLASAMLLMGTLSLREPAGWPVLLAVWFVLGLGYSAVLTPSGRLLRFSSQQPDRPALFAAQFALSHACWLVTYPLAGWMGAESGMATAFLVLGGLTALGTVIASALWPVSDPEIVEHIHENLPPDDPHVRGAARTRRGPKHAHAFVIDDYHPHWPRAGQH
jgi:H+ antiporter protein